MQVVTPPGHPLDGQLGVRREEVCQPGGVAAVQDGSSLDLELEPGPAGKPVLTGHGELRRAQGELLGYGTDPSGGRGIAAFGLP